MGHKFGRSAFACIGATAIFAVAGCGGGGNDDSGSTSTAASTAASSASTAATPAVEAVKPIDSTAAGAAEGKKAGDQVKLAPKTIGFLDIVGGLDSTVRLGKAINDSAKLLGWKVVTCDGQGDPSKTAACASSLLSRNVDAIVSDGVAASVIAAPMRQAAAKNIPVIDVGGETPGYPGNYAPDEKRLGEVLAAYYKEQLAKVSASPVDIAVSAYAAPWAVERTNALKALVAADSKLKISTTSEPDPANLIEGSRKATQDELTQNPNIKAFWVDFDAVGQVVGQQVASQFAGKSFPDRPLVGTFHADQGTNKLISSGAVDAAADVPYEAGAWVGMDQLAEYFGRKTALSKDLRPTYGSEAGDLYTYQIVTKANVPAAGQYAPAKVNPPQFFTAKWKAEFGQ